MALAACLARQAHRPSVGDGWGAQRTTLVAKACSKCDAPHVVRTAFCPRCLPNACSVVSDAVMNQEAQQADSMIAAITVEVSRMTLGPGDVLVIKVPVKLSQMQEERVRRQVKDTLPLNGAKCLVLHSGMDIAVLRETKT